MVEINETPLPPKAPRGRGRLELKDWLTLSMSGAALFVSIASASVQWRKEARDEKSYLEDRTPIVDVSAGRFAGGDRRFSLKFDITNTPLREVDLLSIKLTEPKDYNFKYYRNIEREGGGRFNAVLFPQHPTSNVVEFRMVPPMARSERAAFEGSTLEVPDAASLPEHTSAAFAITFKIHDNAGTIVTVNSSVRLNW